MESVILRVRFDENEQKQTRPFHVALVPMEVWKGSKFERSFVTSLGQVGFEKIAKVIGSDSHEYAEQGYRLQGAISEGELAYIEELLRELQHKDRIKKISPNWAKELKTLHSKISGHQRTITVISDIYVKTNDKEMFFELKSSKPNADQSLESKRKMLQIQAMKRGSAVETYFALPDNPFGSKQKYDHPHPMRYFDMRNSPCVIMGKDFWDKLGGSGTWEELIAIFQEVGIKYKKRIKDEYLNGKVNNSSLDDFI